MKQKQKISTVRPWPLDWNKHIVNTSLLYFEDKKIQFIKSVIFKQSITVSVEGTQEEVSHIQLDFLVGNDEDCEYFVSISFKNNKIIADICCLEEGYNDDSGIEYSLVDPLSEENHTNLEDIEQQLLKLLNSKNIETKLTELYDMDFSSYYGDIEEIVLLPIGETILSDNPYDVITQIEEAIEYDYNNRDDGDENDDNDNDDKNSPSDNGPPSNFLNLKPDLLTV